jgi:quercetin dioxygenase-like cupin family protein
MKTPLAMGCIAAALAAGGAFAGGPTISGGIAASGVVTHGDVSVHLSAANGFLMEWAKVPPGASFGWHFHRRPVAVAVTSGTLTLYDSSDPSCKPSRYTAGQGFVEAPNHVHIARNEGTKTVSLYAIYLGVSAGWRKNPTPLDALVKSPGNCPAGIQ